MHPFALLIILSLLCLSFQKILKARHHSDEVKLLAVGKDIASKVHTMIQKGVRGELEEQNANISKNHKSTSVEQTKLMERLEKLADMREKGF
jgi:hypothetical protein